MNIEIFVGRILPGKRYVIGNRKGQCFERRMIERRMI